MNPEKRSGEAKDEVKNHRKPEETPWSSQGAAKEATGSAKTSSGGGGSQECLSPRGTISQICAPNVQSSPSQPTFRFYNALYRCEYEYNQ